jgi:hypothetical protein
MCIARVASTIVVAQIAGKGIVIAVRAKKKQFAGIFLPCVATSPHARRYTRAFPSNRLPE